MLKNELYRKQMSGSIFRILNGYYLNPNRFGGTRSTEALKLIILSTFSFFRNFSQILSEYFVFY